MGSSSGPGLGEPAGAGEERATAATPEGNARRVASSSKRHELGVLVRARTARLDHGAPGLRAFLRAVITPSASSASLSEATMGWAAPPERG